VCVCVCVRVCVCICVCVCACVCVCVWCASVGIMIYLNTSPVNTIRKYIHVCIKYT